MEKELEEIENIKLKYFENFTKILKCLEISLKKFPESRIEKVKKTKKRNILNNWNQAKKKKIKAKKLREIRIQDYNWLEVKNSDDDENSFELKSVPGKVPGGFQHIFLKKNTIFENIFTLSNTRYPGFIQKKVEVESMKNMFDRNMDVFGDYDSEISDFFSFFFKEFKESCTFDIRPFFNTIAEFLDYDVHKLISYYSKSTKENIILEKENREKINKILFQRYKDIIDYPEFSIIPESAKKELEKNFKMRGDLPKPEANPFFFTKDFCKKCLKYCCDFHMKLEIPRFIKVVNDMEPCDYSDLQLERYLNLKYIRELTSKPGYSVEEPENFLCEDDHKCSKNPNRNLKNFPENSENRSKIIKNIRKFEKKLDPATIKAIKFLSKFKFKNTCILVKILRLEEKHCYKLQYLKDQYYQEFQNTPGENRIRVKNEDCNEFNTERKTFCIPNSDCISLCQVSKNFERNERQIHKGCSCFQCGKKCPCRNKNITCLPELCNCCVSNPPLLAKFLENIFPNFSKISHCKNNFLIFKHRPRSSISMSHVCPGFGLFTLEDLKENQFLGVYLGEWITDSERDLRDFISNTSGSSYFFTLKDDSNVAICSFLYGNKMKFLDHCKEPFNNCYVEMIQGRECVRICMFTSKKVAAGKEVLFNYGDEYKLAWTQYDNKISMFLDKVSRNMKGRRRNRTRRRR